MAVKIIIVVAIVAGLTIWAYKMEHYETIKPLFNPVFFNDFFKSAI